MPRREWSCQRCHDTLGRVTTDRHGRDHLHASSSRVRLVEPSIAQTWIVTCNCGMRRTFRGYQVHLEDDRDQAA